MLTLFIRFAVSGCLFACLLAFTAFGQAPAALLFPYNEVEIEAGKQEKALAVTQEYQAKEKEIKANTALTNNERYNQNTANYRNYLKQMEGLLKKDQKEKARTLLVENDLKNLRAKPALPRLYDMLTLTPEQDAKLKDLNLQHQIMLRTLWHSGNYTNDERNEETKYINEEMGKKFNNVLTPDQRKKLAELKQADAIVKNIQLPPLYQKLNLNNTQTDKLKWLLYNAQTRYGIIKQDATLTPEAKQQKLNEINQEIDQKAFELLNKNQKAKLDELARETNFKLPPVYAELGLTAEQESQVKAALLAQGNQMTALREETNLTPEQKQERLTKMNSELQARIQSILTPEQFTKLATLLQKK